MRLNPRGNLDLAVRKKPVVDNQLINNPFIDESAMSVVAENLSKNGWSPMIAKNHNQKGFDLIASKGEKSFRVEVKGRSVLAYSGTINDSERQRKDTQRFFNFSKAQYVTGDFFVCVFIAPSIKSCIVVPKRDFDKLVTSKVTPLRLAFALDKNGKARKNRMWKNGRTEDMSKYIEGWHLFDEY